MFTARYGLKLELQIAVSMNFVMALPCLGRLVAGLSVRRPGFDRINVRFVADKVAMRLVSLRTSVYPCLYHPANAPVCIIPPMPLSVSSRQFPCLYHSTNAPVCIIPPIPLSVSFHQCPISLSPGPSTNSTGHNSTFTFLSWWLTARERRQKVFSSGENRPVQLQVLPENKIRGVKGT